MLKPTPIAAKVILLRPDPFETAKQVRGQLITHTRDPLSFSMCTECAFKHKEGKHIAPLSQCLYCDFELPDKIAVDPSLAMRQKLLVHLYAKRRLTDLEGFIGRASGPFINLDQIMENPGITAILALLPPLITQTVDLNEFGRSLQMLYDKRTTPEDSSFFGLDRQTCRAHYLEILLQDEVLARQTDGTLQTLHRRFQRILNEVYTYMEKSEGDAEQNSKCHTYAKNLFALLYDAESTCIDNAASKLEDAERLMIIFRTESPADLFPLIINDFKKHLLAYMSTQSKGGETIESFLANSLRTQYSLNKLPISHKLRYDNGQEGPSNQRHYDELIKGIFALMNPDMLSHFMSGISGIPEQLRQIDYHQWVDHRTDYLEKITELYTAAHAKWEHDVQTAPATTRPLPPEAADFMEPLMAEAVKTQALKDLLRLGYITYTPDYPATFLHTNPLLRL